MVLYLALGLAFAILLAVKLSLPKILSYVLMKISGLAVKIERFDPLNSRLSELHVIGQDLSLQIKSISLDVAWRYLLSFRLLAAIEVQGLKLNFHKELKRKQSKSNDIQSWQSVYDGKFPILSWLLSRFPIKLKDSNANISLNLTTEVPSMSSSTSPVLGSGTSTRSVSLQIQVGSTSINAQEEIELSLENLKFGAKTSEGNLEISSNSLSVSFDQLRNIQACEIHCELVLNSRKEFLENWTESGSFVGLKKNLSINVDEVGFSSDPSNNWQVLISALSISDESTANTVTAARVINVQKSLQILTLEACEFLVSSTMFGLAQECYHFELEKGSVSINRDAGSSIRLHSVYVRLPGARDIFFIEYFDYQASVLVLYSPILQFVLTIQLDVVCKE